MTQTAKRYAKRAVKAAQHGRHKCGDAARRFSRARWKRLSRDWRQWRGLKIDQRLSIHLNSLLLIAGVMAVVYTASQLSLTRKQNAMTRNALKAAQRSNALTRDTARRELRAYVSGTNAAVPKKTHDGQIDVTIAFLNKGQTPALGVGVLSEIYLLNTEHEWPQPLEMTDCPVDPNPSIAGSFVYLPDQQYAHTASTEAFGDKGEAIFAAVQERGMTLYAAGCVTYFDVFEQPHTSRFCALYDPKTRNMVACARGHTWMD